MWAGGLGVDVGNKHYKVLQTTQVSTNLMGFTTKLADQAP